MDCGYRMNVVAPKKITPSLSVIDPNIGWIPVTYRNGNKGFLDLKSLIKESHLVTDFDLNDSVSTVSLLRLLVSIAYHSVLPEEIENALEWDDYRKEKIQNNQGFNTEWVETYFSKFEDRFYLLHPTTPFLQDISLYQYYSEQSFDLEEDKRLKQLTNLVNDKKRKGSISAVYPSSPSVNSKGGEKISWGLPSEEIFSTISPASEKILMLMVCILHSRYNHSATNRGSRAYLDNLKGNDTHNAAHAFRCAVSYVPSNVSLFQTIMLAMNFYSYEKLINDVPEWERDINPETGWLKMIGQNVNYLNLVNEDLMAPRSSVNMTHMSFLLFPEEDLNTGEMVIEGGQVKQMRRVLFNFKHLKDADGETKLPFPITWNPFIAVIRKTGKALKQTKGISRSTSMGATNLYQIPLLPKSDLFDRPEILENLIRFNKILPENRNIKVYIFAGDASQDEKYANFTLIEKDLTRLTAQTENADKLESWFSVGTTILEKLQYRIFDVTKANMTENISTIFWIEFTKIFNQNCNQTQILSVQDSKKIVTENVIKIFETFCQSEKLISPIVYSLNLLQLYGAIKKTYEGKP